MFYDSNFGINISLLSTTSSLSVNNHYYNELFTSTVCLFMFGFGFFSSYQVSFSSGELHLKLLYVYFCGGFFVCFVFCVLFGLGFFFALISSVSIPCSCLSKSGI